jgi:GNAT superfamily N-acetyltransferase
LRNEAGLVIGRVAAFIDEKTSRKGNDQPTGGMGFFECIDDEQAAFLLFDQCKAWVQARGMEAMDGPVNFGSRERFWGLLVEGFDLEPNYQCNYHFPYYQKVMDPLSERMDHKARLISKDPAYHFRHIRKSEMDKLPEYLRTIYNGAWSNRAENPELTLPQAKLLVKQMKPIIDVRLIWLGFYNEEPVACFLSLPEINQIFKHLGGQLDWIGKLKFVWYKMKGLKKAFGILFGVVPAHQGKGVDGALIMEARKLWQSGKMSYEDYEMNWIGDFNPKMIQVVEQVGGYVSKRHVTYRKLFDSTKEFKRHPILR